MNYYNEIESYIKKNEISKKVRVLEENATTLEVYWNIGRLLVEAQGGYERAKYGNALIKEWSEKYMEKYGRGYSERELRKMRQFYSLYPIWPTVSAKLNWSQVVTLISIKEENKNLTIRKRINKIKNNPFNL